MRGSLVHGVIDSILKAWRAGYPMTIDSAESALIVKLTDDEREAVQANLVKVGVIPDGGFPGVNLSGEPLDDYREWTFLIDKMGNPDGNVPGIEDPEFGFAAMMARGEIGDAARRHRAAEPEAEWEPPKTQRDYVQELFGDDRTDDGRDYSFDTSGWPPYDDDRTWPDIKRRWQQDRWLSIPATILIVAVCAVALFAVIFFVLVLYRVIASGASEAF